MRRCAIKRKTPLRCGAPPKRRTPLVRSRKPLKRSPLKRRGRKTREWESARAKLKPLFFRYGVTTCQLRLQWCRVDDELGFAHLRKRNRLRPDEFMVVALLCNRCHDQIEVLPHADMYRIVRAAFESLPAGLRAAIAELTEQHLEAKSGVSHIKPAAQIRPVLRRQSKEGRRKAA